MAYYTEHLCSLTKLVMSTLVYEHHLKCCSEIVAQLIMFVHVEVYNFICNLELCQSELYMCI